MHTGNPDSPGYFLQAPHLGALVPAWSSDPVLAAPPTAGFGRHLPSGLRRRAALRLEHQDTSPARAALAGDSEQGASDPAVSPWQQPSWSAGQERGNRHND